MKAKVFEQTAETAGLAQRCSTSRMDPAVADSEAVLGSALQDPTSCLLDLGLIWTLLGLRFVTLRFSWVILLLILSE